LWLHFIYSSVMVLLYIYTLVCTWTWSPIATITTADIVPCVNEEPFGSLSGGIKRAIYIQSALSTGIESDTIGRVTHTPTRARTPTHTHAYTHAFTHACTHTGTHASPHTHTLSHTHTHTHSCMHTRGSSTRIHGGNQHTRRVCMRWGLLTKELGVPRWTSVS
jgi:hypothetical protein